MGNESGTWIMYGVSREDPECIHTVDEAVEYINKEGFLPLFKNEIPGFSLEVIIPGISEPPARTLRATVPENERHIFR